MRKLPGVLACVMALMPSQALAQEEGRIGVTMGFPSSVGILWHATENIAIRPEFSFAWSSSESEFGDSDGFGFGTGISAIVYTSRSDNLATYFSPRYSFTRTTNERRFEGEQFIEPLIESTTRSHTFSGSFGAQYFLGSRFSVFGELGLAYSRTSSKADVSTDEPTASNFGTRSGVGVVFYF
jgi:hypothetical protein